MYFCCWYYKNIQKLDNSLQTRYLCCLFIFFQAIMLLVNILRYMYMPDHSGHWTEMFLVLQVIFIALSNVVHSEINDMIFIKCQKWLITKVHVASRCLLFFQLDITWYFSLVLSDVYLYCSRSISFFLWYLLYILCYGGFLTYMVKPEYFQHHIQQNIPRCVLST